MKILKTIQKFPGGLMVIPLFLGTCFNTFIPHALKIGGFTTALFKNGAITLLALFCLCNGAQITVKKAGLPLIKGGILTAMRLILGIVFGWLVGSFFGKSGLFGIYPLALVSAMTNANDGLYGALAGEYGDASDVSGVSIMTLMIGPFFTMVALGATGNAHLPIMAFIAALVPIIIGFILGNLDSDLRKFLVAGTIMPIPFFAFCLGSALNFKQVVKAGVPGIILGILVTIITGLLGFLLMKYVVHAKYPEVGAAIGTTAGNAAATPAAVAVALPQFKGIVAPATAQIAASVIITAIICPFLVSWLAKLRKKKIKAQTTE